jgi:hypothetical protein
VQDHIGVGHLFQRGPERLDELVRKVPDEPDRIGEREHPPGGRLCPAHRGIEGREQRVLDKHPGAGEPVQQA